ncbi:MAG: hypothetical protein AAB525_04005 [Patescibacteria group bacterium]
MYLLIPILNLIGLEIVYLKYPKLIYLVSACIVFLTLFFIYKQIKHERQHLSAIVITAVLFLMAHYLLILFLEGAFLIHSFIFLTNFALFVFLYCLFDKYNSNQLNLNYALPNIIGYFNLAIFFFLTADVFYLNLNTNQKFLWFLSLFSLTVLALSYSSLKIFNLISSRAALYMGIVLIVLIEMFWTVNLLPVSVYSKAAIVALIYFTIFGLTRHYLVFGWEELSRKVVWRYLSISGLGIILALGTSRW